MAPKREVFKLVNAIYIKAVQCHLQPVRGKTPAVDALEDWIYAHLDWQASTEPADAAGEQEAKALLERLEKETGRSLAVPAGDLGIGGDWAGLGKQPSPLSS